MSPVAPVPVVSVLVVNYNSGPLLAQCLTSLAAQVGVVFEVLVGDNGSQDGSFAAMAVLADERFTAIAFDANLGFAAANNRLAAQARGDWLVLLNPDAFPRAGWLKALLAASDRHPEAELFGSLQLDHGDPRLCDGAGDCYWAGGIAWRGGHGHPVSPALGAGDAFVFSACGAAAMVKAAAFRRLGGFDESFFCYMEDVDLAFRLRLVGGHCVQVGDAVVEHVGGASGRTAAKGFARYHGIRNGIWTFVKNMPGPLFWPLLPFHLLTVAALVAKAAMAGQGGAALAAVGDALCGLSRVWAQRRKVQAGRRVSSVVLARALVWSPLPLLRRAPASLENESA